MSHIHVTGVPKGEEIKTKELFGEIMAKGFSNQTHDPRIQETQWTPGKPCFQAMLVCFFFIKAQTKILPY